MNDYIFILTSTDHNNYSGIDGVFRNYEEVEKYLNEHPELEIIRNCISKLDEGTSDGWIDLKFKDGRFTGDICIDKEAFTFAKEQK